MRVEAYLKQRTLKLKRCRIARAEWAEESDHKVVLDLELERVLTRAWKVAAEQVAPFTYLPHT